MANAPMTTESPVAALDANQSNRRVDDAQLNTTTGQWHTANSSNNKSAPPPPPPPKPSALKNKPRIPLELQAIFLESNRTGTVDKPAPKSANKVFGSRWLAKKKKASFAMPDDGDAPEASPEPQESCSLSSLDDHSPTTMKKSARSRLLMFGANETFLFQKKKPSNERVIESPRPKVNRWNSGLHKKEASSSVMPMRMPRRPSPRQIICTL